MRNACTPSLKSSVERWRRIGVDGVGEFFVETTVGMFGQELFHALHGLGTVLQQRLGQGARGAHELVRR